MDRNETATDCPNALAAGLDAVASHLRNPLGDADAVLLHVGDVLGIGIDAFVRLTAAFDSLPRELEGPDLWEASSHLADVAQAACGIADALGDEEVVLTRLRGSIRKIGPSVAGLRKTVGAISLLSVNARIGAAHLSDRGMDFTVFTEEVSRLAKAVEATVTALDHDHAGLEILLRSAQAEHAEFGRRFGATLRSVARQLETELGLVQARRVRAAAVTAEIGERSRRIAAETGAAVMSLQIGDRTRQRLEHVADAVDLLRQGLSSGTGGWSDGLDDAGREAVASRICLLQSAQASDAVRDYGAETSRISAALTALAADASELAGLGSDFLGEGGNAGNGGSFLDGLTGRVAAASNLMRQCQSARTEVDRVTAALSEMLGGLVSQVEAVRAIETDMRLTGLNATFKCGRLGAEGLTLSTIAHELRACATQTVEDARLLMGVLKEVIADTEILDRQRRAQDARSIAGLENRIASSLSCFERAGGRLAAAMTTLGQDGGQVAALLADASKRMTGDKGLRGFQIDIAPVLDRLGRNVLLTDLRAKEAEKRVLSMLGARYTMAGEREIHHRFAPAVAGMVAAEIASAEACLDDIFF